MSLFQVRFLVGPQSEMENFNGGRRRTVGEPLVVVHEHKVQWSRKQVDQGELAKLRFENGWSRGQLSRHFGVGRTSLWRMLNRLEKCYGDSGTG
jgi:hypothetical protein